MTPSLPSEAMAADQKADSNLPDGPAGRPAWAEVDLEALGRNLEWLRRRLDPAGILAVIKADGYGHGAVRVAGALAEQGVDWLGVALAEEAAELRRAGIELPVLVLGVAQPASLDLYSRLRLTPAVSSLRELSMWDEWSAAAGARMPLHLKVDTGMSRLGVALAEVPAALERIRTSATLELAGFFSHFADADDPESRETPRQARRFAEVLALLSGEERERVLVHLANSGGALYHAGSAHSLARIGLALFGVDPARRGAPLQAVMSVRARIVLTRQVEAGARAGYGGTWRALRPSRLAVVPLGYGDGYPWRLSGRGEVLVRGRRAPLAGRVSMDMTIVDVTEIGAEVGDEVILLGRQGGEEIGAWELAERAGTIPWETLCRFGRRLPRRYLPRSAAGRG